MSDIVQERLVKMAGWAKVRKDSHEDLKEAQYVRIGGTGYKAVSVSENSPLTGFSSSSSKTWGAVLKDFSGGQADNVLGKKEERRLQAFMIRHALVNNMSIKKLIGTTINKESFDDILLAFDEISLGDNKNGVVFYEVFDGKKSGIIRCDLLCVAIKGEQAFPLLIELKYDRSLSRLVEQLEEFSKQISEKYRNEFETLLESAVGRKVGCSKVYKMMIWPPSKSGKEQSSTLDCLENSGIAVVEYIKQPAVDDTFLVEAEFNVRNYD